MADTYTFAQLRDSLPTEQDEQVGDESPAVQSGRPPTVEGWKQKQVVDYTAAEGGGDTEASAASARVYDWDDEYGEVGPKIPELEGMLFGDVETREDSTGLDFTRISDIEVIQEGPERIEHIQSFDDAGLHPAMRENVELAGYACPTPIQKYTIPAILQGHDVIGVAQTGSGKTAAYLIPILSKMMGKAKKLAAPRPNPMKYVEGIDNVTAEPLVLIIVPTRELAVQIFNEARKFCYRTMLRPCIVYGGSHTREQMALLGKGCDVLIGTPGRLKDFIERPHVLTLRRLKYTVIDEADEMLENDWQDELGPILSGGDQDEGNVKFCLFSATFPKEARDLAKDYLAESHVRFRVGRAGSTTENIKQVVLQCDRSEKRGTVLRLLMEMSGIRTIIFVNSRMEVDNLDDFLWNSHLPVVSIHSDRSQRERENAMRAFRSGDSPILIATGVCARGIDVRNVNHVINYELPSIDHGGIEEYIHRIGRTGRIGHRGVSTSLFTERDEPLASVLARTLLETNQQVPDFLQIHLPEGMTRETVKFETESDFDPNDIAGAGDASGGGWGAGGDEAADQNSGGGWGVGDTSGDTAGGASWGGNAANSGGDTWGTDNSAPGADAAATGGDNWGTPAPDVTPVHGAW